MRWTMRVSVDSLMMAWVASSETLTVPCRRSISIMKPPLAAGISTASPVRASSMKVCDEFGSVPAVAAMMVTTPLGSSSSQPRYCTTSPGR